MEKQEFMRKWLLQNKEAKAELMHMLKAAMTVIRPETMKAGATKPETTRMSMDTSLRFLLQGSTKSSENNASSAM